MKEYKKKDWLYNKYWLSQLSSLEMAKMASCCTQTILDWMIKFDIPRRKGGVQFGSKLSKEIRKKRSEMKKGKKHPNWKGGKKMNNGYIHVRQDNGTYTSEHRLIAENALGRKLREGEVVHHINGIKVDNRNENLLICTGSYHRWFHLRMAKLYQDGHFSRA